MIDAYTTKTSVRLANALMNLGTNDFESLIYLTEFEFLSLRNVGRKTLNEAKILLGENGLRFKKFNNAAHVSDIARIIEKREGSLPLLK